MVHSLIKIFLLLMDIATPLAYMCFLVIAVRASLGVATFELINVSGLPPLSSCAMVLISWTLTSVVLIDLALVLLVITLFIY